MEWFSLGFYGNAPEGLRVGDRLLFEGAATVREIAADMVDITAIGREPEFALGEVRVDLVSNRAAVARPEGRAA